MQSIRMILNSFAFLSNFTWLKKNSICTKTIRINCIQFWKIIKTLSVKWLQLLWFYDDSLIAENDKFNKLRLSWWFFFRINEKFMLEFYVSKITWSFKLLSWIVEDNQTFMMAFYSLQLEYDVKIWKKFCHFSSIFHKIRYRFLFVIQQPKMSIDCWFCVTDLRFVKKCRQLCQ